MLKVQNGTPVLVKDVGDVVIGHAPRLGQFGFMTQNDAVEGIVLMRTGEQAQTVLKRVEQKTAQLNNGILPADVKVRPYYDRSELIALTTHTVRDNLLRGILLVIVVLIFFLYDIRSGLIVAAAIPLSLLFAFICLDLKHIPANLLSIGAIDFGILVDGAVVMVENIYRQLSIRGRENVSIRQVIASAAAEVDRPIVYAVAVIVAGFLPIYVLSGPSGRLFQPMADTTIFALIGALIVTLTVIPVLCSVLLKVGLTERRNSVYRWVQDRYEGGLAWSMAHPRFVIGGSRRIVRAVAARVRGRRRRVHAEAGRRRAVGARDDAVHDLVRRIVEARAADSRDSALVSRSDHRRVGARPARRRHRSDRILQRRVLRRAQAVRRVERRAPLEEGADRGDRQEALGVSRRHLQLHAAGRRRGGRGGDRA